MIPLTIGYLIGTVCGFLWGVFMMIVRRDRKEAAWKVRYTDEPCVFTEWRDEYVAKHKTHRISKIRNARHPQKEYEVQIYTN